MTTDAFKQLWGEGGGCLVAGTLIQTPTGLVPIEDIEVGDEVYCFTPERTIAIRKVQEVHFHPAQKVFRYCYWGGQITATPNHAFYTEHGAFKEIGQWEIDSFFIDKYLEYRPLLKVYDEGYEDTYNFEVADYHTYLIGEHGIFSSNGGGGKSKNPRTEADTAVSGSKAVVVEAVSEGPVEGLLKGEQSILLDRTPVANADGTKNFEGFTWEGRTGTATQAILNATIQEGITTENNVGTEVKFNLPITRTFVNSEVDFIRVKLGFQAQSYTDDGDVLQTRVAFKIYVKEGVNGAFVERYSEDRNVKFSSLTEFEYNFPVDNQGGNVDQFSVRVEKLVEDPTDAKLQNTIQFQSFTEVINSAKINYAHTAVISVEFNAEQFSSEPQRAYEIGGRTVAIPTNATVNPDDRGLEFDGVWDGTLYEPPLATSDVSWQVYDILTNKRYGLGRQITPCQVSTYDLYEISKYNNEFVSDGFGGTERRFRCNTVLQKAEPAHKVIEALLSACNAHYYWDGTCIRFWQDRPGDVIRQFTNSDVEDGKFQYSSTDIQTRFSVSYVTWNDPEDYYRQSVEAVEVQDVLQKFGYRENDFAAYGCTSRGQAYRQGRYQVYTNFLETETVNFKTRLIGLFIRPGDIINVIDWKRSKQRYGGLIGEATTTSVKLDQEIILPNASGYTITCTMPDLTLETKAISNGAGSTQIINLSEAFSTAPLPESNWFVDVIQPRPYRVQMIKVDPSDVNLVEVMAGQYRADKYDIIENGFALEPIVRETLIPPVPPKPVNLGIRFITTGSTYKMIGTWDKPSDGGAFITSYQVQWKEDINGSWSPVLSTSSNELIVESLPAGTYYIRVASVLLNGGISQYAESGGAIAGGDFNMYLNFSRPLSIIAA